MLGPHSGAFVPTLDVNPPKRTWRLAILIATNSFEFRRSIQHSQAGFDPPFAEGAEFTE